MKFAQQATISHYRKVWGENYRSVKWKHGPTKSISSRFMVLEFPPRPQRKMWTYATCCMWEQSDEQKLELHIFSPTKEESIVELLTAIVHYHQTEKKLNLFHTINFGRPWLPKSHCEYGLVSLPYLDGPSLEILETDEVRVRFLWLIPITKAELEFKMTEGVEKLEQLFDQQSIDYLDPKRSSVV